MSTRQKTTLTAALAAITAAAGVLCSTRVESPIHAPARSVASSPIEHETQPSPLAILDEPASSPAAPTVDTPTVDVPSEKLTPLKKAAFIDATENIPSRDRTFTCNEASAKRLRLWMGYGTAFISDTQNDQSGTNTARLSTLADSSWSIGGDAKISDVVSLSMEYDRLQGHTPSVSKTAMDSTTFLWKSLSLDALIRVLNHETFSVSGLIGAKVEEIPFFVFNSDGSQTLSNLDLPMADVGGKLAWRPASSYDYTAILKLEVPIDSMKNSSNGASTRAKFGIAGGLSMDRHFDSGLSLGLHWDNETLSATYDSTLSGNTQLFNSRVEVRAGFDF